MENKILVETSARHIHLTDEALEILGIETLEVKKDVKSTWTICKQYKIRYYWT